MFYIPIFFSDNVALEQNKFKFLLRIRRASVLRYMLNIFLFSNDMLVSKHYEDIQARELFLYEIQYYWFNRFNLYPYIT
jgi:hypothetical protein